MIRQILDVWYIWSYIKYQSAIGTQNTIIMTNLIVIVIVIFIVIAIVIHGIKWTVTESHFGANKCPFSLSSNTAEKFHTMIVIFFCRRENDSLKWQLSLYASFLRIWENFVFSHVTMWQLCYVSDWLYLPFTSIHFETLQM